MAKFFQAVIQTARPTQWIKNLIIFAALVFKGNLFNQELFLHTVWGFLLFSILASSIYFINDIKDKNSDKIHPFKKNRPIAKGTLTIPQALFISIIGIVVALYFAQILEEFFFYSLLAYLILQLVYTFWLKQIIIFDIFSIAAGFVLRIYAGAFLINAHLSVWFLLCVISVSLFLATGKRRAELAILTEKAAPQHRSTLSLYNPVLLDSYLAMFATSSWIAWSLFTFFAEQERQFFLSQAVSPNLLDILPLTILGSGKLLMITIPVVIFGIMRYLHIVYQGSRAETPEKVLISDKPLFFTAFIWGILIILIIYGLNTGGLLVT